LFYINLLILYAIKTVLQAPHLPIASESILWWTHELIDIRMKNKQASLIETVISNERRGTQ
jgi:hypothetical protein